MDNEDVQQVHIRRSHVLADAFRYFSKETFCTDKILKVQFFGESAVDDGGPRREFFHLLLHEIFKSSLFTGYPKNLVPAHNIRAVSENKYFTVGKMIATCIIQGGEVPACFANAVSDYLVLDRVVSPVCLDDIADHEIKDCLKKVRFYCHAITT